MNDLKITFLNDLKPAFLNSMPVLYHKIKCVEKGKKCMFMNNLKTAFLNCGVPQLQVCARS